MIEYTFKVYPNGNKEWCLNGQLHREDGPAVEDTDGYKAWCLNGKYHREDGPAIEYPNGNKFWYIKGNPHRKDGPAMEFSNGSKQWWLNGEKITEEEFLERTTATTELTLEEIAEKFGIPVTQLKIKK